MFLSIKLCFIKNISPCLFCLPGKASVVKVDAQGCKMYMKDFAWSLFSSTSCNRAKTSKPLKGPLKQLN